MRFDPPIYQKGRRDIKIFYLKPAVVFIPHLQFVAEKLICQKCKNSLIKLGWASNPSARYIHDLDSGIYFVQYLYRCKIQTCEQKSMYFHDLISSLSPLVKYSYPLTVTALSGMTDKYLLYLTTDVTTILRREN